MTQKPIGTPGEPPYLSVALAPEPEAASLARTLVADACLAWRLPELLHPARRVMSELVLNAVEHAGTDLVVTITRRGNGLHLAVCDGDPGLPRLRVPAPVRRGAPLDVRGRGLQAVQAVATEWGVVRTPTGKIVWAVVEGVPSADTVPPTSAVCGVGGGRIRSGTCVTNSATSGAISRANSGSGRTEIRWPGHASAG